MEIAMSHSLDRSKQKSIDLENKSVENPWDEAIAEAQRRIADFKFSIRVFRERKARGEPWRGSENAATRN